MSSSYTSVPFKAESGLYEISGIAKFSSAGIIVEYESKLIGLFKGKVQEVRIPLEEILDVQFRKGFFKIGAKIHVRLKNFAKLSQLPSQEGKLTLKIKREDHKLAKEAVDSFHADAEDARAELPPPPTPVSSLFDTEKLETPELPGKNPTDDQQAGND